MANSIYATPRWKSFDQLEKNLGELVAKVERQGMREAVRKAATPMLQAARAKAPRLTGLLVSALEVVVRTYKRGRESTVMALIGIDRHVVDDEGNRPSKYGHLVELGTQHSAAHPYMRPAFDETKDQSIKVYADSLKPAIERVARRVNKRVPI